MDTQKPVKYGVVESRAGLGPERGAGRSGQDDQRKAPLHSICRFLGSFQGPHEIQTLSGIRWFPVDETGSPWSEPRSGLRTPLEWLCEWSRDAFPGTHARQREFGRCLIDPVGAAFRQPVPLGENVSPQGYFQEQTMAGHLYLAGSCV